MSSYKTLLMTRKSSGHPVLFLLAETSPLLYNRENLKGGNTMFGKEKKQDDRFYVKEKSGSQLADSGLIQVIVDKETGVNYLWVKSGYAGGLTPLLDAEGKPIVERY